MGDYLSVYDGIDLQATQILQLDLNFNDKRKTVSTSGNQMMIQFLTDDQSTERGTMTFFVTHDVSYYLALIFFL